MSTAPLLARRLLTFTPIIDNGQVDVSLSNQPSPTTVIVTSFLSPAIEAGVTQADPVTILVTSTKQLLASSPTSTSSYLHGPPLLASSTSTLSTTRSTSPTPLPDGSSASAKIGIGLGVPLSVIVLAIVAFLGYLYGKRRGNKGNTVPLVDEQFRGFPGDKDPPAMRRQDGAAALGPQEPGNDWGLPRYTEELQGTPGVKRYELPAQREATGYFSPDIVAH